MTSTIENQRAVFVLGMHRSGTSAMARVVSLMGLDLGYRMRARETIQTPMTMNKK